MAPPFSSSPTSWFLLVSGEHLFVSTGHGYPLFCGPPTPLYHLFLLGCMYLSYWLLESHYIL